MCSHASQKQGERYIFVLVDDYSTYTWTLFLAAKNDAFEDYGALIIKLQNKFEKELIAMV